MATTFSLYNRDQKEFLNDTEKYSFSKKDTKPPADENAPKRPMTAYMLYCDKHRAKVMKELGEGTKVGDIQKKLGEMWKACTGAERTKLEEKAKKSKAMYDRLLSAYRLSGNYRAHQERLHAFKIHRTKLAYPKDENMPKRALSAYMLYCNEHRPKVMKKFEGKPITETMKALSKQWNALDEKAKAKWNKKAEKAKADRAKEIEKYKKSKKHQEYLKAKAQYEKEMEKKREELKKQGVKRQLEPEAPKPEAKKAKKEKRAVSEPRAESVAATKAKKKVKKASTAKKPSRRSTSRSAKRRSASRSRSRKARKPSTKKAGNRK